MLNISNSTKVYVPCIAGVTTGGAELLHQVVDIINNNGGDAYIVYFGNKPHNIPSDYLKYNIKLADKITDEPDNVALIYEGDFIDALRVKRAQVVLWWLSVDNYFLANRLTSWEMVRYQFSSYPKKYPWKIVFIRFCKGFLHPEDTVSLRKLKHANPVCNCFQSEYAKDFLERHSFNNLYSMKDYINDDNFSYVYNPSNKENIIAYNPKKGFEFTKKLIDFDNTLKWVPIINLNRDGVIDLLRRAKLYVDFGYHPGKDRLPREAAINGCCIVTGKKGAAGYKDVDIPSVYKHNQEEKDIPEIIQQLHELISNYDKRINDFKHYRDVICSEKAEFINAVKHLFLLK